MSTEYIGKFIEISIVAATLSSRPTVFVFLWSKVFRLKLMSNNRTKSKLINENNHKI